MNIEILKKWKHSVETLPLHKSPKDDALYNTIDKTHSVLGLLCAACGRELTPIPEAVLDEYSTGYNTPDGNVFCHSIWYEMYAESGLTPAQVKVFITMNVNGATREEFVSTIERMIDREETKQR